MDRETGDEPKADGYRDRLPAETTCKHLNSKGGEIPSVHLAEGIRYACHPWCSIVAVVYILTRNRHECGLDMDTNLLGAATAPESMGP